MKAQQAAIDALVDKLFKNGNGQKAVRLVLVDADGRDLGGWCRGAVRDQIFDALASLRVDVEEGK